MKLIICIAVISILNFTSKAKGDVTVYQTYDLQGNSVGSANKLEQNLGHKDRLKKDGSLITNIGSKIPEDGANTVLRPDGSSQNYNKHLVKIGEIKNSKNTVIRNYNSQDPNLSATVPNPNRIVGNEIPLKPHAHQSVSKESICHAAGYTGANDELDEKGNVTCFKTIKAGPNQKNASH